MVNHYRYFVKPVQGDALVLGALGLNLPEGSALDDALAKSDIGASRVREIFKQSDVLGPAMATTAVVYWMVPKAAAAAMRQDAERLQRDVGVAAPGEVFEADCTWSDAAGASAIAKVLCARALARVSGVTAAT